MKKIISIISFFALSLNVLFAQAINEEKIEHKLNRNKWYEQMHKTSGSINWRVIDYETRKAKFNQKQSQIIEKLKAGESLNSENELVAGGRVTAKWTERGSNNVAGRIRYADIDFKNNLIYAASDGGNIWKSDFTNISWTCLNEKFSFEPIRFLKILPNNRIFVVKNNPSSCYYSDNDGLIWNESAGLDDLKNYGRIKRTIALDNEKNNIYILAEVWNDDIWDYDLRVFVSEDNAVSFKSIYSKEKTRTGKADLWAQRYGADRVILALADSIFEISLSGAVTFLAKAPLENYENYTQLMIRTTHTTPSKVHFGLTINDPLNPAKSAVRFVTYNLDEKKVISNGILHDFNFFEENSWDVFKEGEYMVCGGVNSFTSYYDGQNWTKINDWTDYYDDIENKLHADIPAVIFLTDKDKNLDYQLICTDGGLYISDDYTESVKNISLSSLNTSQYYSTYTLSENPNIIAAGAQDQGYQISIPSGDGLLNFEQIISGDYGHFVSSDGGKIIYGNYPGFLIVFSDITTTRRTARWNFEGDNWLWIPPIVAHPNNPKKAYIMSGGKDNTSNIWEINYLSSIFIEVKMMPFNFKSVNSWEKVSYLAISKSNSNKWYAVTSEGVFFSSTNAGTDWTKSEGFDGPNSHYFYGSKLLIDPTDDNIVYIAGSGYESSPVWITKDGGITFEQIGNGLPNTLIFDMEISTDGRYIFAGTQVGPYMYFKDENKWYDIAGLSAPDQEYWTVEYLPEIQTARFATYGRGIWDFKIQSISPISNVTEAASFEPSLTIKPNPVKDKAYIEFNIDKASYGELKIYDISGKVVKSLFAGDFNAGKYSFGIEKNKNNLNLNQIYFVVLTCLDKAYYSKILFE